MQIYLLDSSYMNGLFESFLPFFRRYTVEVILFSVSFISLCVAITFLITQNTSKTVDYSPPQQQKLITSSTPEKIAAEVSGSVVKPGVYLLPVGSRIKDLIDHAGGYNDTADTAFIQRNINLSRILLDQDKIHVPSSLETNTGLIVEPQHLINYLQPVQQSRQIENATGSDVPVDVNSATVADLDNLPGIGKTTAEKIIANRPYANLDELVKKNVLRESVLELIRDLIITSP